MMSWLKENWPKSTIFLAVYSTIFIFLFVLEKDIALFLIWIQLPIYWLHQFEEFVFPGGFMETFNRQILGSDEREWPLSRKEVFWINIPIISEILTSRNFNCNLFRCEGQRHPGTGVDI